MEKLTHSKYFNGFKEMLNPTDIYSAIKPLYFVSKMFGLAPFCYKDVKTEGRIRISVLGIIHSYLMCCMLFILLIVLCKLELQNEFPEFGLAIIVVSISDTCVSSLGVIASYILCATINRRKLEKFLYLVYRIDACLIKTVDCYKTICVSVTVGIVALAVLYSVLFIMCSQLSSHFGNVTLRCISFLFHILGTTMYFQFVYSVLLLKQRFKILNEDLMTVFDVENENILDDRQLLGAKSKIVSRPVLEGQTACEESPHQSSTFEHLNHMNTEYIKELPDTEDRERSVKITVLRRAHSVLCDASELVTSMFHVQSLVGFIEMFIEITLSLYATLTYVTGLLTCQLYSPSKWNVFGVFLIWATMNFAKLVAVTASCHSACQHANRTAVVVHKLLVAQSVHPETTEELQLFSQQLLHRKCHFSVCGFFSIDLTLLYSMAGSITTCIVILLQYTGQEMGRVIESCNTSNNAL